MTKLVTVTAVMLALAGCDGFNCKISQEEKKELTSLREEKKSWTSERTHLQESLDMKDNEKHEAISERNQLREALEACQRQIGAASEAKPKTKEQTQGLKK